MKDLSDIVCAIAGPMTSRSLDHMGRGLETLYVKSTAQGASAEEQAAFTPALIAQVMEVAKRDNARMTVDWGLAIYDELQAKEIVSKLNRRLLIKLHKRLFYNRDKARSLAQTIAEIENGRAYPTLSAEERERQAEIAQCALRQTQEDISRLEKDLRDLHESPAPVSRRPPQKGSAGSEPAGHDKLDSRVPFMPPENS